MRSSLVLLLSLVGAAAFPTPPHPTLSNVTKVANAEYSRVEGDILLSDEDMKMMREKRGAPNVAYPTKMWPLNQVISWKLVSSYDATFTQSIRDAFKFWTDNSCLNYQENGPTTPVIQVIQGAGCSSQLGRQAGSASQTLNLESGCERVGTIVHEIAHSIGLGHTHARADRDSYVTINFNNIKSGYSGNFNKYTAQENNNFGVEYDYSSVMHYDATGLAIDENIPVIKTLNTNAQWVIGQRERASFSDVKLVNLFYNCAQKCPSATVKCQNGGIINSKTCNSCLCPPMFVGSDCSQRAPAKGKYASSSCGADLTATASWQNVQGQFGAVKNEQYLPAITSCFWNIKAPAGKKIEVRVNKLDIWADSNCVWNYMDIYMKGFAGGQYRFCDPANVNGKVLQSKDNGMSIQLVAGYSIPSFNVDYRLV